MFNKARIEWVNSYSYGGFYLTQTSVRELGELGDLTRESVLKWMDGHTCHFGEILPVEDIHVVCGDTDIPWATDKARKIWNEVAIDEIADIDEIEKEYASHFF